MTSERVTLPYRHIRLELSPLARVFLSPGSRPEPLVRLLCRAFRYGRGQRHLLSPLQARDLPHWGEKAPAGFRYVFKVPRLISHRKRLHDCQDLIEEFTGSVALTGDRFGLALLQLPPGLHQDLPRLETALRAFGDPRRVAVEFRHPSWLKADTRDLLERLGSSFVATDSPQGRPLDWLTGDYGYIRLHGRTRWYDYDYAPAEIEEIAALAEDMVARGAREVYVFFNNDTAAYAPGNAQALRVRLDAGRSGHSDG